VLRDQPSYAWSNFFAWGLTLSGAALAMCGVIGMFAPETNVLALAVGAFAGMMVFGIGLVNCSASACLQALKHRKAGGGQVDWAVFLPGVVTTLGFMFATNVGVHLGWSTLVAQAPAGAQLPGEGTINLVFYIFAFAKPAAAWLIEGRKAMDHEAVQIEKAVRRAQAGQPEDPARDRAPVQQPNPAPAEAGSTPIDLERERERRAGARTEITEESVRAAAGRILARGEKVSFRSLAAEMSTPKTTLQRAWPRGVGQPALLARAA
jgi:hypothetical protein